MDILIMETGNGGDMVIRNNDVVSVMGFENMPYLANFGGEDWWGNDLLLSNGQDLKFSATTERVCRETPLTSAGRIIIENAIKSDLAFLATDIPGTTVIVTTAITGINTFTANININGQTFSFNWHPDIGFLNYQV